MSTPPLLCSLPGCPSQRLHPLPPQRLTFCRVWRGSWLHGPKTGPWSLVVSCSSWARSSCSSSGTIRNVPTWAERSHVEGRTALPAPHAPSSQNHWPMDLLRSCTVPLAKIFAKPPPSDGSGPQRDCQGVGRKGTREEDPRLLTPSDILPLDDTEEKERMSLLCPGLSRWPVPSSQGSQDCSDVGETFCVWPRTSSTRVLPNS